MVRWTAILLTVALLALSVWDVSADKRGRWLHEAAWRNNTARAKLLVQLGTDVNYTTGNGTALHGAAYQGNIELMTFLIQHGAIVDQRTKFNITPLWQARQSRQAAAEQLLLAHGANPDTSEVNQP
jgi:ankyrin repeat protein